MSSSNHTPLTEGDLVAYLDGDASNAAQTAIEADVDLMAEVSEMRLAQQALAAGLARAACPESDDLLMFQASLLTLERNQAIAMHVEACTFCQAEMQELEAGIEIEVEQPEPVATAPNWVDALRAAGRRVVELGQRPMRQSPAFALRGKSEQLIFESDAFQVVVALKQDVNALRRIEGQVVNLSDPLNMPSGQVALHNTADTTQTTALNEFGHFIFSRVAEGNYTLQIDTDAITTLTASLDIVADR